MLNRTLWHWICTRLLSLAIGSVILVAFLMWLRFFIEDWWLTHRMPASVRQELAILSENPQLNINRYHQIIDTWYGLSNSDPSPALSDWLLVGLLILVVMPLIFFLALRAVRPLASHISRLATVARSIADGNFGVKVAVPPALPTELNGLTHDLNGMSLQLERYERELKASQVALAHELRSPLTAAIGRLQGMIDGVFEPSTQQLGMVMKQMTHLSRLIEDLHLLSLAEAGQLRLELTNVNVGEIIREKVAWLKPRLTEQGFYVCISGDDNAACEADPFRLGQVISIFPDNALRYAADGERLDVHYSLLGQEVVVTFRDYGAGVSDEFMEQLFIRFTRAEASRSRHSGGSGLGLSIALAICHAHNGDIFAKKLKDGGLLFTVTLPRQQRPE